MTLIKSISGIRGTLGGKPGDALTPNDLVKYASAYAAWLKRYTTRENLKVVVGRDARPSGEMCSYLVCGTLLGMGIDVLNIGMATTPTVEMAVALEKADGGIILTASHNPREWNALKLLDAKGEFLSADDGQEILEIAESEDYSFAPVDRLGAEQFDNSFLDKHIEAILGLSLVDVEAIRQADFKIAVDAVNSVGGVAVPKLLAALGVKKVVQVNCRPTGKFAHNPEPLPEHLGELRSAVIESSASLGIAVDPDVDRLAMVCEEGSFFGEEYTLVAVADYVLRHEKGPTVSNLSSSRALADVAARYSREHFASAVGEVNVVQKMKDVEAAIGGEGNGGVIYPKLHYGRDALVGIALFLSHLAKSKQKASEMRAGFPNYHISKNKIQLSPDLEVNTILSAMSLKYKDRPQHTIDGVRIEFEREREWVHLRMSNTEPIIRIYCESPSHDKADELAKTIMKEINALANE